MNPRKLARYSLTLVLLALPVLLWWNQTKILDWWKLRNYSPPAAIARLADVDTMTADAKHLFYINHPELIGQKETFRQICRYSEQTIVLGCYHSGQSGIALYDVQDPRLNGVEEVTAAHEMLHGAYERLEGEEKTRIDSLLNNYYQSSLSDERIKDTINRYKQTDPAHLTEEMHSIFGTEVMNLPPELEGYYKKYFSDRKKVVQFSDGYEQEFAGRLARIEDYDQRLASLKDEIVELETSLKQQVEDIEEDRQRLDSQRQQGDIAQYNSGIASFNAKVTNYNQNVARLRRLIGSYNQLVTERNSIASELRGLEEALDTRLTTQAAR